MSKTISKINLNDYKPLRDVIFNTLREAIIKGEFLPGERLMEIQLSEKMGVSRTPVREAIRKLELEGLVIMIPRKGAHVSELTVKNIMDVLEVRASLDALAAALAAERMSSHETTRLKDVYEQFVIFAERENLQGLVKKDVEFHEIIYKSSRNEKLIQIASNLREQIQRFRIIYLKDYSNPRELIKEHAQILEAILAKNPQQAKIASDTHIQRQEEAMIRALEKKETKN